MSGSMQRISGQVPGGPVPGQVANTGHPSQNHLPHVGHSGPIHTANAAYGFGAPGMAAAPPKSNTIVFVLIAILVVAIAVLAYLVVTK
jgi:hypothetical protein